MSQLESCWSEDAAKIILNRMKCSPKCFLNAGYKQSECVLNAEILMLKSSLNDPGQHFKSYKIKVPEALMLLKLQLINWFSYYSGLVTR